MVLVLAGFLAATAVVCAAAAPLKQGPLKHGPLKQARTAKTSTPAVKSRTTSPSIHKQAKKPLPAAAPSAAHSRSYYISESRRAPRSEARLQPRLQLRSQSRFQPRLQPRLSRAGLGQRGTAGQRIARRVALLREERVRSQQFVQAQADDEPAIPEAAPIRTSRLAMPAPLFGSHESLERQNEKSEGEDGLERIQDEDDLADRIAHGFLVPVPASANLSVNQNLPESHRYCRPWTAQFLSDLATVHAALFHRSLEVSSAVRTVEYQKRLMGINGNAAAAEGDIASPHLTGGTIDIAKAGMSLQEIAWMRARLLPLEAAGKIDVEEEFRQSCFHITVYKSYVQPAPPPASPDGQKPVAKAKAGTGRRKTGPAGNDPVKTAVPSGRDLPA